MLRTYEELKQLSSLSENEFMLLDRLQKIESVIRKYGEDNFYVSFSGGKDSTVLSALVDLSLPENRIPRVFIDTGIELNLVKRFVCEMAEKDKRVILIEPQIAVKPSLERDGYPFKSKRHAHHVERYNRLGMCDSVRSYLGYGNWGPKMCCPNKLKYQFSEEFSKRLKVSDLCCINMKEKPLTEWGRKNNRPISIVGLLREEGGRRERASCLAFEGKKLVKFQPLSVVTKEWEEWFIKEYHINICSLYLPPYNFKRTSCKGCPNALHLQEELDILEEYFPNERKQCEYLWHPVYAEYREIGLRLKPVSNDKLIA